MIRSIEHQRRRFPHTGAMRYAANAPRIPALAISNPDADALERQFESGKPVRLRCARSSRELPQVRSANVIGEIPRQRSRQRDRDSRRAPRFLGSRCRRARQRRGGRDHDERRPSSSRNSTRNRVAPSAWCCSRTKSSARPARRHTRAAKEAEIERHVLGFEADFGAGPVWRLSSRVNPAQLPAVDRIYRALAPLKSKKATTRRAAAPTSRP